MKGKRKLGLGEKKIKWSDKLADELHKPVKKVYQRRRLMVSGPGEI